MTDEASNESLALAFSPPFNWCDMRCERCPIASSCPLPRREAQRNWVRAARRAGPSSFDDFLENVVKELTALLPELQRRAAEEGIDLAAPLPELPVPLEAVRLRHAGMALVDSLSCITRESSREPETDELMRHVFLLVTKSARIAGHLSVNDGSDLWWADGAPVLLLLERLKRDTRRELAKLGARLSADVQAAAQLALEDLDRILDPLIATVGETARLLIDQLTNSGLAPSPFCTLRDDPAPAAV